MYAGQANSPNTVLSGDVDSTTREITVDDASVLPAAPFLLTIGYDTSASETVLVTEKDGNTLTITRAVDGSAQVWVAGIKCARVFTAKDLNDLQTNVGTLLSNLNSVGTTTETLLADLADTYDAESVTGYAVGDYCIYSNMLYRCTTQIAAGGEAWTAAHWEEKPVGDVLKDQAEDIADLEEIAGNGVLSGFTATDLTGAANELKNTLNHKADQSDLASINLTGTTNTTGSQIDAGTYFYLNGVLVKAKADIASGATFTSGTNYEAVTAGEELSILNLKWDGILIASGTDLNTITIPGIYRVVTNGDAQSLLNCPTTKAFTMLVIKRGDTTNSQIIFMAGSSAANIYIRASVSNGWLQWYGISLDPVST